MAAPRRLFDTSRLLRLVDSGEKLIAAVLAVLLLVVTAVGSLQLLVATVQQLSRPGLPWLGMRMNALLGDMLILLIALEVLQNITAYLRRGIVQIQLVLITAITAVARKVIVLPPGEESKPLLLVGLGVAVLSLAAAYWLLRRPTLTLPGPRRGPTRSFQGPDRSPPGDGAGPPE
ncbi:MAG: phosphate-starvation-inducible PsiE family protein [Synechococcaceae cyanobacterium]|nr:phosphate-starvation-inducible PsiE family protein [Synechococcaceae cyanobacterium]